MAGLQLAIVFCNRVSLARGRITVPLGIGQLIALVGSLRTGVLNASQSEAVRQLRSGMAALVEREKAAQAVNVLLPNANTLAEESSLAKNAIVSLPPKEGERAEG